jgi:hypothetical protein
MLIVEKGTRILSPLGVYRRRTDLTKTQGTGRAAEQKIDTGKTTRSQNTSNKSLENAQDNSGVISL